MRGLASPFLTFPTFLTLAAPTSPPARVPPTGRSPPHPPVMFRGTPEHTGYSDAAFFSGQGGVRWEVHTGGAVRSSPAVTRDRVFVGSGDGFLYAIDRASGGSSGAIKREGEWMLRPQ